MNALMAESLIGGRTVSLEKSYIGTTPNGKQMWNIEVDHAVWCELMFHVKRLPSGSTFSDVILHLIYKLDEAGD